MAKIWFKEEKVLKFFESLNLNNLRKIVLNNCSGFTDQPLHCIIQRNKKIQYLFLPYCWSRVGYGLHHLAQDCPLLQKLNINNCGLSNQKLQFLTEFRNLKSLSLAWTKVKNATIIKVVERNPDIEKINLLNCKYITREGISIILEKAKKLKYINVVGTKINYFKGLLLFDQICESRELTIKC